MKAIQNNQKTINSYDNTTNCPKKRAGEPCSYCYVECSRRLGFNAKKIIEHCPYNHEVLNFSQEKIDRLNSIGGLRMFSFGDYMPEHKAQTMEFLNDCLSVGLKVKAITKQPLFVAEFGRHPAINVINVSVDNTGDGMPWHVAKHLKSKYSKVKIRCAIMKDEDIEKLAPWCDVLTFNHARGLKELGYKLYSKKAVKGFTEVWKNKVCCSVGTCEGCACKCGLK